MCYCCCYLNIKFQYPRHWSLVLFYFVDFFLSSPVCNLPRYGHQFYVIWLYQFRSNAINPPEAVYWKLICSWNLSKNLLLRCTFFVHCNYCCYYELIYTYKTHTLTTTNIEQIIILNCNLIDVKCRGNVSNKMQTQSIVLIGARSVIIVMDVKWLRKLSSSSLSLSVGAR